MATLRIRQLRKAAGLSQAELASAAGITQSTVSRIENGTIALDAESGAKIAHALGVEPVELHDHDAVAAHARARVAGHSDPSGTALPRSARLGP